MLSGVFPMQRKTNQHSARDTEMISKSTLSAPQDVPYIIQKRSRLKAWVEIFHRYCVRKLSVPMITIL